jgi:KUP system potassium uptake protein
MGHFGATPIRLAWSAIVFPSLVLNYAGQAAIVLDQGVPADNIFYWLWPAPLLVPMIVLATVAIAVSATMLMTSALLLIAMREILQWSLPVSIAVAGIFLVVDTAFLQRHD